MAAATLAGVNLLWISTVRKEKEPQVSCQDFTMLLDSVSDFRSYLKAYGFSSSSCTMMINEGSCDFELSASNDEKGIIVPGLVSLQSCPKVTFLVLTHLPSLRQKTEELLQVCASSAVRRVVTFWGLNPTSARCLPILARSVWCFSHKTRTQEKTSMKKPVLWTCWMSLDFWSMLWFLKFHTKKINC